MADVWKSIGESLTKGFDKIWDAISKSTSILVSSAFIIFALGSLFGYFIATIYTNQGLVFLLLIPPILGLIAYYYRTFAIIIFILFLLLLFL